jgi:hypothetical protein
MMSVTNKHFRHGVIMLNVGRLRIVALTVSLILQLGKFLFVQKTQNDQTHSESITILKYLTKEQLPVLAPRLSE